MVHQNFDDVDAEILENRQWILEWLMNDEEMLIEKWKDYRDDEK